MCLCWVWLQHDRPATNIDATYPFRSGIGAGPQGELWTAASLVSGQLYASVFGANLVSDYTINKTDAGFNPSDTLVAFEANSTSAVSVVGPGQGVTVKACGKYDFQLYTLAPVLPNGTKHALVGTLARVCRCVDGVRVVLI